MQPIYLLVLIIVLAYLLQIFLGLRQLKHFNAVYGQMRQLGRVAIGRRSGKLRSGTIVMFALDADGKVLAAQSMQGVTVLAQFKSMPAYKGQDIHYLDTYNPLVRAENRLLQIAIEDAREVFLRVEAGNYQDLPKGASALDLTGHLSAFKSRFKLGTKN